MVATVEFLSGHEIMAINPPSDIVLDVVKAADPASRRQAAERLAKLADTAAPPTTFEQEMDAAVPPPGPPLPFDASAALVSMRNRHALEQRPAGPHERFEAFVLQSFIESMLPKGSAALFGEGTAGEIWRSMLAEGLGSQMARGGGIGIADHLAQAGAARKDEPPASGSSTE